MIEPRNLKVGDRVKFRTHSGIQEGVVDGMNEATNSVTVVWGDFISTMKIDDLVTEWCKMSEMESFPPNSNPFIHDSYNMGTKMGKDLMVMHGNHSDEECRYLLLVNTKTGKRMKVEFFE